MLGKYVGIVFVLATHMVIMTAVVYGVLAAMSMMLGSGNADMQSQAPTDPALLIAVSLIFAQLVLVAAVALFIRMAQVFSQGEGHWPTSWQALAVDPPPTEPLGHPYVLDGAAGRVGLSPSSPLGPLPSHYRTSYGRSP